MKIAALYLIAAVGSVWAQATASITGTVTDSTTRLPLHRALVVAASGPRDVTAADGSFTLQDLAAGDVKLRLAIAGYRALDTSVKISDGDHLSCYFELHPMARIKGKVIDKDTGEPVSRQVTLTTRGRNTLLYFVASDKNGEFEFSGLEPGDYTLALDPLFGEGTISFGSSEKMAPARSYGRVEYPGTLHIAEGEQQSVAMRVSAVESHSVAGLIEYPSGYKEAPLSIGYGSMQGAQMQPVGKHPQGPFRIEGLLPGAYYISVIAGENLAPTRAYGSVPVTMSDQDVEALIVKLVPGTSVAGGIRMAENDASLPQPSNLTALILGTGRGSGARSEVLPIAGGQFHAEGVARGEYWPELDGLPDGYAVADVLFDNATTAGKPISLDGPADITFVVTSKAGAVVGTVRDQNQAVVKGAEVSLVPEAYRNITDPPVVMRVLSGASGEFKFKNLAPGNYTIEGAAPFKVQPGETVNISVVR